MIQLTWIELLFIIILSINAGFFTGAWWVVRNVIKEIEKGEENGTWKRK